MKHKEDILQNQVKDIYLFTHGTLEKREEFRLAVLEAMEEYAQQFKDGNLDAASQPERMYSQEEADRLSISFAVWSIYDPMAIAYRESGVTAYQLLEKYKDRPYINTDTSKQ